MSALFMVGLLPVVLPPLEWKNEDRFLRIRSVFFRFLFRILSQSSAYKILSDSSIERIASAVGSALR